MTTTHTSDCWLGILNQTAKNSVICTFIYYIIFVWMIPWCLSCLGFYYKVDYNIQVLILEVKWTPDPDTSGNRGAKPDPRYPIRSSTIVLISRITVYSILTMTFSLWAQSSYCQRYGISARAINILRGVDPTRIEETRLGPDLGLRTRSHPDTDFLFSLHP